MERMIRMMALALVIAAIFGGLLGGQNASAANGYEQWVDEETGCYSYWDGFSYTMSVCARADGGANFLLPINGQWIVVLATVPTADGGLWVYYDGIWYFDSASIAPTTTYGYPQSLYFQDATLGAPTWSNLSGIPFLDQIVMNGSNGSNAIWLAPYCKERHGDICYY